MSCAVPTVEPFVVPDTFVTGASPVHLIGDNVRLTLVTLQRSCDGSMENTVVSKLVGSRSDLLMIAAAIVKGCYQGPVSQLDAADGFLEFLAAPIGRH
jgi:hypothetical protein